MLSKPVFSKIAGLLPIGAGAFFLIAGFLLHPIPKDPDALFEVDAALGTFFFFCFWLTGLVSWGRSISGLAGFERSRSTMGLARSVAFGSAGAACIAGLLGHLGLLGAGHQTVFVVLIILGIALDGYLPDGDQKSEVRQPWSGVSKAICVVLVVWILSKVLRSSIPHFHSDPLYDHLVGPALWSEAGRIYPSSRLPLTLKCSYWEYLFLWGDALVGGYSGHGLIESQLFAQWIHSALGLGGMVLLLNGIFARIFARRSQKTDERFWCLLALCASVSSVLLDWTSWLAKDDYGSCLWAFSGFLMLLELPERAARQKSLLFLAGLFFGFSAAIKFTTLFMAGPFFLVWIFLNRSMFSTKVPWRACAWTGFGAVIALAPLLIRNGLWTGNPFFPYFGRHFHSDWLSGSQLRLMNIYEGSVGYDKLRLLSDRLAMLARREPLVAALPFLLVFLGPVRRSYSASFWYSLCPYFAVVLFLIFAGPPPGRDDSTLLLRYLGPALPFALGCSVFAVRDLAARGIGERLGLKVAAAIAICALTLLRTAESVKVSVNIPSAIDQTTYAIRAIPMGGEVKAWLRMNADASDLIVSTGESQIYYISYLNVTVALTQPYLDHLTSRVTDPDEAIRILYNEGTKFVLDVKHAEGGLWGALSVAVSYEVFKHPDAIAFSGRDGFVADLPKLYGDILDACPVVQVGSDIFLLHTLLNPV